MNILININDIPWLRTLNY